MTLLQYTNYIAEILKRLPETSRPSMNHVVNIERLVSFLNTILAASATPKRTFSELCQLRTYMQSTMSQKRSTHLLILYLNLTAKKYYIV